jgi:hypothetical protein
MNYFPKLTVVADDLVGPLPTASSIRQSDLNRLNSAWGNIQAGHGMQISGTPEEKQTWNDMLAEGIQRSSTFRSVISDIGNNTNTMSSISVNLVSGDSEVLGDDYPSRKVDLMDLSHLSFDKSAANPQQMTAGEAIVHFLAERVASANNLDFVDVKKSVADDFKDPTSEIRKDFNSEHAYGLKIQNLYRSEMGQLQVTAQDKDPNDPTKTTVIQKLIDNSTVSTKVDYDSWGDFIWNQVKGATQSTTFNPGLASNSVEDSPPATSPTIPDTGEGSAIDDTGRGGIDDDSDDGSGNALDSIKIGVAFDPAQHWQTAAANVAGTTDYENPRLVGSTDDFNASFNTTVQEGQITAPVSPIDNVADTRDSPIASPIAPELPEMDAFNNPANTFSASPDNAFSSAGQMSSFEPAASFNPSEPAENIDAG